MSKTNTFRDVIAKMMEAVTLDDDNKLQVIDEGAMAEADELLNSMVVETARDWWSQLESAEGSLADMADEISFSDSHTDPSHAVSADLSISDDEDVSAPTLESIMGEEDFDLGKIFENFGEDDEEFGPDDGDEQFDDLMRGDDENGLGDDSPMDDNGDDYGDDLDVMGGDDDFSDDTEEFDFSFLDDVGEDDFDVDGDDDDFADDEFSDDDFADDDFSDDGMTESEEGEKDDDDDDDDEGNDE